jgi:predicted TIM-barrel fold metal-dependent hydrolase
MPRFDVHAHFIPETVGSAQGAGPMRGSANFRTTGPVTAWSPARAIAFMDERGVALQLLSMPIAGTVASARAINDRGARIVADRPDRFGLLAALPLADPDRAVDEVRRASDELGADGFVLTSNYDGAYLGDPRFDPVFAELDRRRASIFLHPIHPVPSELCLGRPGPLIELPMDTARTVVDAIFAGVFLRHPGIRMVLAHAGGVLPTLSRRILALGTRSGVPNPHAITPDQLREQMASLYFETAVAGEDVSLGPAVDVAGPRHLLYGTDFPAASEDIIDAMTSALSTGKTLAAGDVAGLDETFRTLFPAAAARAEQVPGAAL